jgi:TRAP-type C4-dicarboxylate transport system permease small subunit
VNHVKSARNIAIVALIAAAVYLLPGGGRAAQTFLDVVYVAFGVAIGYLGLRLYREHRVGLHGLGDLHRGLLYGAISVGLVTVMARARMWQTGLGELLWFVLIGAVVYALIAVVRRWRAY